MPVTAKSKLAEAARVGVVGGVCFNRGFWPVCPFRVKPPAKQSSVAALTAQMLWVVVMPGLRHGKASEREKCSSPSSCVGVDKLRRAREFREYTTFSNNM